MNYDCWHKLIRQSRVDIPASDNVTLTIFQPLSPPNGRQVLYIC